MTRLRLFSNSGRTVPTTTEPLSTENHSTLSRPEEARTRSTLDDLLDHYDHAIRLVGPDPVGIGSDFGLPGWEGTEPDAEWERHRRIYGEREWETLRGRFPPYIEEVNHAGRYRVIAQGLERRGHSSADIEKILGLNFLRLYRQVLKP